eukprot:scaffold62450_cov33-Phaeocystis_antarctica.AAC.1
MGSVRRSKNAEEALEARVNTLESKVFWRLSNRHTRRPSGGRAGRPQLEAPSCERTAALWALEQSCGR